MFNLRFLNNLKQKLTTGNRGSIYLNALSERYLSRLDVADLDWLQPNLADDFLTLLTSQAEFRCSLTPDGRALEDDEQQKRSEVLRRLSVITIENNDHFSEQGVQTFGFGFPILLYRDQKDPSRIIKAPLFVWSLDIERNIKRANEWIISRKDDFSVISNVVLAAYLRMDAGIQLTPVYDQLLEDAILDKEEIAHLVSEQVQQLHPSLGNLDTEFQQALNHPIQPILSRQQIDKFPLDHSTILWSGIFGLFKSQKESIINDLDYFIHNISNIQEQIQHQLNTRQALLEHSFTAVDTDPSQQHLIHLLQKGNNLVIQGPPGTGKSQTLTGIIANILSNKGTCLIVCEKKTALEVIYQNLADIGLGELAIIIEDIYRDRPEVVNSVRERAQKQHPNYKTRPSYIRLLEACSTQLDRLQQFHHTQLKALLEERSWAALVNDFLEANEEENWQVLAAVLESSAFQFDANEFENILPIFPQGKQLLTPLGSLEHPHHALHQRFFKTEENQTVSIAARQAKLDIQRALVSALRLTQNAKELTQDTLERYQEELEAHYKTVYQKKTALSTSIYHQAKGGLEQLFQQQLEACQSNQKLVDDCIQTYHQALKTHFETTYQTKLLNVETTAAYIKQVLYQAVNEALHTIKAAQEDIMGCLYEYEKLLEQHFEQVFLEKVEFVDAMIQTIEVGLNTSPYYFTKNKGVFRAVLRGVGTKYKALENDKNQTLKQWEKLQKLHKKHQYFSFEFKDTQERSSFTFDVLLEHVKDYKDALYQWHDEQTLLIQKEVRKLSSKACLKAVPYKKEAQTINQHLSDFREKILRNPLIELDFKYETLRLRQRFDQLDTIKAKVTVIKKDIDAFIDQNEANWDNLWEEELQLNPSETFRTAYQALQKQHKLHDYFEYDFAKLGRPKLLGDYYTILRNLTDYRNQVEAWFPSTPAIISSYATEFKSNHLFAPVAFEEKIKTLNQQLKDFVQQYNQQQLFKLPFELKAILFSEQLLELQTLERQLEHWKTNFDNFLSNLNQQYFTESAPHLTTPIHNDTLVTALEELQAWHEQHDYFDYVFADSSNSRALLQQNFLQGMAQYHQWNLQWYNNRAPVIENWVVSLQSDKILEHVPLAKDIDGIGTQLQAFQKAFNDIACLEKQFEFEQLTFQQRHTQLQKLEQHLLALQGAFEQFDDYFALRLFWMPLSPAQQEAYKGLSIVQPENWETAFTSWYLHAMLEHHAAKIPDQASYTQIRDQWLASSQELKKMLVTHSLRYWRSRQTQAVAQFHQEKAPIKLHSLYNKRGHTGGRRTPLRKIIATSPELFMSFFPVLLVSPSVCSSILPLQPNLFDAVIFDEASQLRLEDTFCALVRGNYKIVSGDSQQMPPSDYFQSSTVLLNEEDHLEDEDDNQALINESIDFLTQTESLLEFALAEGDYKESFLEVHYRSRHPYLIDFSNAAFYGNRLSPMPAEKSYTPIEFNAVNGAYINYTNKEEAEQIIDYLVELARPYRGKSCPSVGIATFNIHQRNLILELIQQRAVENRTASNQLQKLFISGLFVKNLENIQGDERDILIISTTFGRREDGSFRQNFGPINRRRGFRLLNVIITRAKQKVCVFTSIPSQYYERYRDEIIERGNMGKGVLYAYLAYAKAVSQEDEATREAILQLLYQHCLNKPIDNVLYQVQDNDFKERVAAFLQAEFPNRVLSNYQYAGFKIPLVVKDIHGHPKLAFYYDTYHEQRSEEAYAWDLFREHHLTRLGFDCHRIWSKDWWQDSNRAKNQLIQLIQSL